MITYNDIYEAARKERYSDGLQPLPKSFIDSVSAYLRDKREIANQQDDGFSDIIMKTKKQLENAVTLFKELMIRRRKKILNLVLIAAETGISKQDFENMLTIEKDLFEELMKCVEISDKRLDSTLSGNTEVSQKHELVVFNEPIDAFLGVDGEMLGPFEKGQVANLPKEVVQILKDDQKVATVE